MTPATTTAVLGAGLAGLVLAGRLRDAGRPVVLFDKGRAPGGRLATRRAGERRFDHGPAAFAAENPGFRAEVQRWIAAGVVARWRGVFGRLGSDGFVPDGNAERFVGAPRMSALPRSLAEGLDVRLGRDGLAERVERRDDGWRLGFFGGREEGPFARLVVTVPAPQAAPLLADAAPGIAARLAAAACTPAWCGMLAFDDPFEPGFDAAESLDPTLAAIVRDAAKPGRDRSAGTWVVRATEAWSREHLEEDKATVAARLADAFRRSTGAPAPDFADAHRWRYAYASVPSVEPWLWDESSGLGACGDGFAPGRAGAPVARGVEDAWLSASRLADRLLGEA